MYDNKRRGALRELVNKYAASPYLAAPQVALLKADLGQALAADRKGGVTPKQGSTGRLLEDAEKLTRSDSPFEEDRLLTVARYRATLGDEEGAERTYQRVLMEHPEGAAAERAREWLASRNSTTAEPQ